MKNKNYKFDIIFPKICKITGIIEFILGLLFSLIDTTGGTKLMVIGLGTYLLLGGKNAG